VSFTRDVTSHSWKGPNQSLIACQQQTTGVCDSLALLQEGTIFPRHYPDSRLHKSKHKALLLPFFLLAHSISFLILQQIGGLNTGFVALCIPHFEKCGRRFYSFGDFRVVDRRASYCASFACTQLLVVSAVAFLVTFGFAFGASFPSFIWIPEFRALKSTSICRPILLVFSDSYLGASFACTQFLVIAAIVLCTFGVLAQASFPSFIRISEFVLSLTSTKLFSSNPGVFRVLVLLDALPQASFPIFANSTLFRALSKLKRPFSRYRSQPTNQGVHLFKECIRSNVSRIITRSQPSLQVSQTFLLRIWSSSLA